MKTKRIIFYLLILISVAYLTYDFLFLGFGYGMMSHHFGYYDEYSNIDLYLRIILNVTAYILIFISGYNLLKKTENNNYRYIEILNRRLSNGEISIDEYQKIKKTISRNK